MLNLPVRNKLSLVSIPIKGYFTYFCPHCGYIISFKDGEIIDACKCFVWKEIDGKLLNPIKVYA